MQESLLLIYFSFASAQIDVFKVLLGKVVAEFKTVMKIWMSGCQGTQEVN